MAGDNLFEFWREKLVFFKETKSCVFICVNQYSYFLTREKEL